MKLKRQCSYCHRLLTETNPGIKPFHAPLFYCDRIHQQLDWQNMPAEKKHRISMSMHIPYENKEKV